MSVFPKRTSTGDTVIIHNAFHLRNFKEGIYFPLLEISIIHPEGKKELLLSEIVPVIKTAKESEAITLAQNKKTGYKFSPLLVLGRFFSTDDSVEELTSILSSVASGKHVYHTYSIPENALPGKYIVETIHYLNGEKFYSKNQKEDFFYVEKIEVQVISSTVTITNQSTEDCPVKYIEYNPDGHITHSDIAILKGKECRSYHPAYKAILQYNEDRKVLPLASMSAIFPIQNPRLSYTENNQRILVFSENKKDAYELENEYWQIWTKSNGKNTKEEILASGSTTAYEELVAEKLIIER